MSDNEIVKALKQLCDKSFEKLKNPIKRKEKIKIWDILCKSLDLINRQKAEIERLLQELQYPQADTVQPMSEENIVHCKECKHLMFSDFEGECSKGYKGIVRPNDSCPFGVRERGEKQMTKKELKYINSLKEENERVKNLLLRFVDALGKLKNLDDVVNMSLIPLMTEENKKIRAEIKAEAYKECIEKVKALFPSDNEPYQYWEIHEGADNLLKELG